MANLACGVHTVAVANEVLAKARQPIGLVSWTRAASNWHRMRVQMPLFKGGLGLTPQCASGLAAFYSASNTFVGWLAQRPHCVTGFGRGRTSTITAPGQRARSSTSRTRTRA